MQRRRGGREDDLEFSFESRRRHHRPLQSMALPRRPSGACEQAERSSVEYVNCHQALVDFIQHILQSSSKQRYFGKYLQYLRPNSLKISSAIPITVLRERHKGGNDD